MYRSYETLLVIYEFTEALKMEFFNRSKDFQMLWTIFSYVVKPELLNPTAIQFDPKSF